MSNVGWGIVLGLVALVAIYLTLRWGLGSLGKRQRV